MPDGIHSARHLDDGGLGIAREPSRFHRHAVVPVPDSRISSCLAGPRHGMAVDSKGRKRQRTHPASGRNLRTAQRIEPRLGLIYYYSHQENAVSVIMTPLPLSTEANLAFEKPINAVRNYSDHTGRVIRQNELPNQESTSSRDPALWWDSRSPPR